MNLGLKTRFHLIFVNSMHLEDENLYVNAYMGPTQHEEHMGCIKTQFGQKFMKMRFHVIPTGL